MLVLAMISQFFITINQIKLFIFGFLHDLFNTFRLAY